MEDRKKLLMVLESEDKSLIRQAVDKLASYDDEEIVKALASTLRRVKSKAVLEAVKNAFLEMSDPSLCRELVNLFDVPEPKLRQLAIEVLVHKGEKCLDSIREKLVLSEDPNMRKFALDILSGIKTKESLKIIGSMTADEHPNVRNTAIEYLRNFSEFKEEVVKILINVIKGVSDLYSVTTLASTIIYGNIKDRELVLPLKKLLERLSEPLEKHWVYKSLLFLGEAEVVEDALENARKIGAQADIEKDLKIFNVDE